jgi:hypothetical protein
MLSGAGCAPPSAPELGDVTQLTLADAASLLQSRRKCYGKPSGASLKLLSIATKNPKTLLET